MVILPPNQTDNSPSFPPLRPEGGDEEMSFLETVLENIPDMIFIKEARELRFVRFNKAGEQLLGHQREELLGKNDYDFFPKEQADFFTSKDRMVLHTGELLDIPEEKIQTASGLRILHTKKIPLYGPDGAPQYLVGISEDITEKKQVEEARQRILKEQVARQEIEKVLSLQDDFFAIVSHELRSPLTTLKFHADVQLRQFEKAGGPTEEGKTFRQFVALTKKYAERLDLLVEDMLEVSRIRSGKLKIIRSEFSLNDLIVEVLEKMQGQFGASGVPKFVHPPGKVTGTWDKSRIEQVLVNLLSNAVRYGRRGPIEVHLEEEEQVVHFFVKDQGIGIGPENILKIFERFERGREHREGQGLGLGLYICKNIVDAHQGKIWVESERDVGSTFHVLLPKNFRAE